MKQQEIEAIDKMFSDLDQLQQERLVIRTSLKGLLDLATFNLLTRKLCKIETNIRRLQKAEKDYKHLQRKLREFKWGK